jgi:hypothetical protein
MGEQIKGPEQNYGTKKTDLSAETPTARVGPPWRTEPAGEVTLRGRPAELFSSAISVAAWFVLLRFGLELNRYLALVLAAGATWLFGGTGVGGGRIRLIVGMRWWGRDRHGGGEG